MDTNEYCEPLWKNQLRGGFAYETASFGIHPSDTKCALKMYYLALVSGITLDEIKTEAERYLKSRNVIPEGITEHLQDVERFYKSIKLVTKRDKAWLITFESLSGDKIIEEKVIAIKGLRTPFYKIAEFIEQYYMATYYSPIQKLTFLARPKNNPYQAVYPHPHINWKIYCGENPRIFARQVKNLAAHIVNGVENLMWEEIELPLTSKHRS